MSKLENKTKEIQPGFKRIYNLVTKDTSGSNESKKIIVIIRILVLACILYFTANVVLCNLASWNSQSLLFYVIFMTVFIGMFVMSYHYSTIATLWCFNVVTVAWIFAIVHYLGWNIGVQHFLMLMLVLYFFSSYRHHLEKILFAAGVCGLRIFLFYTYQGRRPIWNITGAVENALQVLNTFTIFLCLSIICYFCSKQSQELEGKLVEYNNQLMLQANTDTLTGLFNRRKAMEYMNGLIRNNTKGFSLCICDIDFFKKVNDNYGHDFGDEVLKKIAQTFKEEMQGRNLVARWGGEEFLLLFPEANGDETYIYLEKIRKKIKETVISHQEKKISITMTFGLAEYDFSGELEPTLKEADEKLYMGKERGRDIVIF